MKLILSLFSFLLCLSLPAMPTEQELSKVLPLVQGLMKPDVDAMKQGKKSRADVATSAMELYAKTESPAAKMLLARNAFTFYARSGEYKAAAEPDTLAMNFKI